MEFTNLKAELSNDKILEKLNCTKASPLYDEFLEELLEIKEEAVRQLCPVSAMAFSSLPGELAVPDYPAGTQLVYVISTIGDQISEYVERYFSEGDYVKGMLADALADTYLFELEKCWGYQLIEQCRRIGKGISKRLEIPQDLPMEIQRAAFEAIGKEELPGIRLSDKLMFYPVKSICHVFVLSDEADVFQIEHNCRVCNNKSCNMRHVLPVELSVSRDGIARKVLTEGEETVLETLQRIWPDLSTVCGGKGVCGKCRIRVKSGRIPASLEDRDYFTEEELMQGWRLSCRAYPYSNCEIEVSFGEDDMTVLSQGRAVKGTISNRPGYGIAVDIGTTTLAAQLLSLASGEVLATEVCVNHQRRFGADVISRIQASNEGKGQELQESIQRDVQQLLTDLLSKKKGAAKQVCEICLAGNTTMGHLLMGYPCETLGKIPFLPFQIEEVVKNAEEILGKEIEDTGLSPKTETRMLPGISAFVGADIAVGLLSCGFDSREEACLFLDLGTNGEMAVGNRERIYVTSTAAGPAFEGGNIRWGCASVPGAICHVRIREDGSCTVETIGDHAPVGICGTGLIEAVAELLLHGFMDETGRLCGRYAKEGYPLARTSKGETILLLQKDIRELQLAKAAVRAGMDILTEKYGTGYGELAHIFVAGGFGHEIDLKRAAQIGLFPGKVLDRIETVGNTALAGTGKYLTEAGAKQRLAAIRQASREVALARERRFQECYVEAMCFEE